MNRIFISYSRKNTAFVRDLYDLLLAKGYKNDDIWVDWQDIPLTADWWVEITKGIENANNVIFVMTPDSLNSPVCQQEVAYARLMNKRIIPLVQQDISGYEVPENWLDSKINKLGLSDESLYTLAKANLQKLGEINWVILNEIDINNSAFQKLLEAIELDLPYLNWHTQMFVRAKAWLADKSNTDLLLSGKHLQAAEEILFTGTSKNPHPHTLHYQFIGISRQVENSKQTKHRLTQAALLFSFLLISVIATLFALYSRQAESELKQALDELESQQTILLQIITQNSSQETLNDIITFFSIETILQLNHQLYIEGRYLEQKNLVTSAIHNDTLQKTDAELSSLYRALSSAESGLGNINAAQEAYQYASSIERPIVPYLRPNVPLDVVSLDGLDDWVVMPALNIRFSQYSIALFIHVDKSNFDQHYVFDMRGYDGLILNEESCYLKVQSMNFDVFCGEVDHATGQIPEFGTFAGDDWYRILITCNTDTVLQVYIDAVLAGNGACNPIEIQNSWAMGKPYDNSLGFYYRGYIDDFTIWNQALADGVSTNSDAIIGQWIFSQDDPDGILIDDVGQRDGLLISGASIEHLSD